jgi:hypothetical protein
LVPRRSSIGEKKRRRAGSRGEWSVAASTIAQLSLLSDSVSSAAQ